MTIHREEFAAWKVHPITEEFFNNLQNIVDTLEDRLLNGVDVESHPLMAQQTGLIRAYKSVLEYSPDFDENGYMIDDDGAIVE